MKPQDRDLLRPLAEALAARSAAMFARQAAAAAAVDETTRQLVNAITDVNTLFRTTAAKVVAIITKNPAIETLVQDGLPAASAQLEFGELVATTLMASHGTAGFVLTRAAVIFTRSTQARTATQRTVRRCALSLWTKRWTTCSTDCDTRDASPDCYRDTASPTIRHKRGFH